MAFAWPGLDRTSDQRGSAFSPSALPPVANRKSAHKTKGPLKSHCQPFPLSWLTIGDMRASDVLCAQARCSIVIPPSREPSVKPWACLLSKFYSWLVVCQLLVHLLRLVHVYTTKGGDQSRACAAPPQLFYRVCSNLYAHNGKATVGKCEKCRKNTVNSTSS